MRWVGLNNPQLCYTNGMYLPLENTQWLNHPGSNGLRDTTDTWGVRLEDVNTLEDISSIVIGIAGRDTNDDWCFDSVRLDVNGQTVFSKSVNITLNGSTNTLTAQVADREELRAAFSRLNRAPLCALPSGLTYPQLRRQTEGFLGDMMIRSVLEDTVSMSDARKVDMEWGLPGRVTVTGQQNGVLISARFRMTEEESPFRFEATATLDMRLSIECSSEITEATGGINRPTTIQACSTRFVSPVRVVDTDVDPDSPFAQISFLVQWLGQGQLRQSAEDALSDFSSFERFFDDTEAQVCANETTQMFPLCDTEGDICGCPNITYGATQLGLGWNPFGVYQLNVPSIPDLACLRF
jgi:hypothetical protein